MYTWSQPIVTFAVFMDWRSGTMPRCRECLVLCRISTSFKEKKKEAKIKLIEIGLCSIRLLIKYKEGQGRS